MINNTIVKDGTVYDIHGNVEIIKELPKKDLMLKAGALKEAKFANLPKDWGKKFKALNRRDIAIFELPKI